MALDIEKRHGANCSKGYQEFQKDKWGCTCPYRITGTVNGKRIRQQTDITDRQKALDEASRLERIAKGEPVEETKKATTIEEAVETYLSDAVARNLASDSQRKLVTTFRVQLLGWAKNAGYLYLQQIANVNAIRTFRGTWVGGSLSKSKKQDRIISFLYFCLRSGFIHTQPVTSKTLGRIVVDQKPTDYFTPEEFQKLIDATYIYRGDRWESKEKIDQYGTRLRTLVLLMRWTGLRIRDALTLRRDRLTKTDRGHDAILLRQAKTDEPVYCVIPPHVATALQEVPPGLTPHPDYFFWSGIGLPKSAIADWQRSFAKLRTLAGITYKRAYFHMLRDTFAVESLRAGIPLEKVSTLLGHTSIKITEKHYKPHVKALQWDLEDEVMKTWGDSKPTLVKPGRPRKGQSAA